MAKVQKRVNKTLEIDPDLHAMMKAEAALAKTPLFEFTDMVIRAGLEAEKSEKAA